MVKLIPVEAAAEHTQGEAAGVPTEKSNACPPGGGEPQESLLGAAEESTACPPGGGAPGNVYDTARCNAPKKKGQPRPRCWPRQPRHDDGHGHRHHSHDHSHDHGRDRGQDHSHDHGQRTKAPPQRANHG